MQFRYLLRILQGEKLLSLQNSQLFSEPLYNKAKITYYMIK